MASAIEDRLADLERRVRGLEGREAERAAMEAEQAERSKAIYEELSIELAAASRRLPRRGKPRPPSPASSLPM